MNENDCLIKEFDENTQKSIYDFCRAITESEADYYVLMSRKAACFISVLERMNLVSFNGKLITDRVLDIDLLCLKDKKVIVIDDVVVSGTTIYNVISRLNELGVADVAVYVLGINKDYYTKELFDYNKDNTKYNYVKSPYILMSDEGCTDTCSKIAQLFSIYPLPYDVDFPKYKSIYMGENTFYQLLSNNGWISYDVSSLIQYENNVKNITLLPTEEILKKIEKVIAMPIRKIGKTKIRILAKTTNKNKNLKLTFTPYFLIDSLSETTIDEWVSNLELKHTVINQFSTKSKIRLLLYIVINRFLLSGAKRLIIS